MGQRNQSGERAIPTYGCMPLGLNEKGVVVGYINIRSQCVALCPYGSDK
jgi:hypothetical protein